jgi:hypothetical protein
VKFDMICAHRLGKLVPRSQLGSLSRLRGTLVVREQHDEELNGVCRRACFLVEGAGLQSAVPTLSDAVLLRASQDVWVFTGVERVASDGGDERVYAQTWLLTPVDRSK